MISINKNGQKYKDVFDKQYMTITKEEMIIKTEYVCARIISSNPYYSSEVFGSSTIGLNISLDNLKNSFNKDVLKRPTLFNYIGKPKRLHELFNSKNESTYIDRLKDIPNVIKYIYEILIPLHENLDLNIPNHIYHSITLLFNCIDLCYILLKSSNQDVTSFNDSYHDIVENDITIEAIEIDHMMEETYLESDDDYSLEADEIKNEEQIDGQTNKEKGEKEVVKEKTNSIGEKILKFNKMKERSKLRIKFFLDKIAIKKHLFYKKNLGKIDHLYELYGGNVSLLENKLLGDPVKILLNKMPNYLARISKEVHDAYNGFTKHYDNLMTSTTMSEVIHKANNYITYPNAKVESGASNNQLMKSIKKDFRFKIGKILLKDNRVYGYTPESIAEKKYPPIQHLLVSLFVSNPHEKPVKTTISDIFDSSESFKIMEMRMKKIVLDTANAMNSGFSKVQIDKDLEEYANKHKDFNTSMQSKISGGNSEKEFKKVKSALNSYLTMFNAYVPIFLYVMSGGSVMYNMVIRIDKMCVDAIKLMLNEESTHKDKSSSYKTGDRTTDDDEKDILSVERNKKKVTKHIDTRTKLKQVEHSTKTG